MIFGPDVSDYQGEVDWAAVAATGRLFGFAKATEGRTFVAETFERNRAGMAAAGLVLRGLYHFARPDRNTALAEADHFLMTIGDRLDAGEVAVLDLETGNIGHAETGAWALAWLEAVEAATGRTPWLYSYESFLTGFDTSRLTRFPLWIAGYGLNDAIIPSEAYRPGTDRWDRAVMWQYTSKARMSGIGGDTDDNVFEGTLADLQALASGAPPAAVAGLDHLHPIFAARVANACRVRGTSVYSGARSTEDQAELWRRYQAGTGNPANRPGTSWHEYGPELLGGPDAVAVDFNEPYPHGEPGLIFPLAGEPWHGQPTEIPETARVAGAERRLPASPAPKEEPEVSKVAYPLAVQSGETRRLPILAIGGGFGWARASVTFAADSVEVRRAIIGPNQRPIAGLAPEGVETGRTFTGRGYVDLEPGDEWLAIELAPAPAGTLDLYVEASDGR